MAKPTHRVQLIKQESSSGGGDDADAGIFGEDPLDADEDAPDLAGVYLQESGGRDKVVTLYRENNRMYLEDTDHAGASRLYLAILLTEPKHEALDTLTHGLNETAHTEVTRTSGRITNVTIYTDVGKATKIRELQITRSGGLVSQKVRIQYDAAGAEYHRLTIDYTRTGGQVTSLAHTKA